jgi:tRNA(Ile)-lysidine synthase
VTIKLLLTIPKKIYLACSGGSDSIGAYAFLSRHGRRDITPVFFDHGTETSKKALEFLLDNGYNPTVGRIERPKDKRESWEEYWRNERYSFFRSLKDDVIVAHHLEDAIESWVFSSLHGEGKLIPIRNGNVIRPFLITEKEKLKQVCVTDDRKWIEDETNMDLSHARNRIRHCLMPEILKINPGISKVIKKKYLWKQ